MIFNLFKQKFICFYSNIITNISYMEGYDE